MMKKSEKKVIKFEKKDYLQSEHFALLCECAKMKKEGKEKFLPYELQGLLNQLVRSEVLSYEISSDRKIKIVDFNLKNKYLYNNGMPKNENIKKFNELVKKEYKLLLDDRKIEKDEQLLLDFFN